ncbi:MAG TPA: LLM class flavin-dependent oxidoreductase [Actinomycetes bacterium]|nr:LLM class flavin-dependent oxidoreductase [Actinomycetes bacterium]
MKVGVGLLATAPGADPALLLEWARRADAGPFASLGIIDRLVYPSFEPLVTLAGAAAVTRRIRLLTSVLVAPQRPAGLLAKQAASLDALSGGRLTLGLAVGIRPDDFAATPAAFADRGRRFEDQLRAMRRIWTGQPVEPEGGTIGPAPAQTGGPEVLIEGYAPVAVRRAGNLAMGSSQVQGWTRPPPRGCTRSPAPRGRMPAGRAGRASSGSPTTPSPPLPSAPQVTTSAATTRSWVRWPR